MYECAGNGVAKGKSRTLQDLPSPVPPQEKATVAPTAEGAIIERCERAPRSINQNNSTVWDYKITKGGIG